MHKNDVGKQCPSCRSTEITIVQMPKGTAHYAALRCGQCDCFLGWMQKPETEEKRRDLVVRIDKLIKAPGLTQWEKEFLLSLKKQKKLSPRQAEVLAKVEAKGSALV